MVAGEINTALMRGVINTPSDDSCWRHISDSIVEMQIFEAMRKNRHLLNCLGLSILLLFGPTVIKADGGQWVITQLPFQYAEHPSINDSGEIVWAGPDSSGQIQEGTWNADQTFADRLQDPSFVVAPPYWYAPGRG